MYLDKTELTNLTTDPNKVQKYILDGIEKSTNGDYIITEPTNPFMMLLEFAANSASNSISESINVVRQLYPNLATDKQELFHHLSDNELSNIFSIPATVPLVLYLNATDLRVSGYRPPNSSYVMTIIPIGTEIMVNNLTFTLLNRISVKLYDNGKVFVEQELNDNDISINSLGILPSGIVSFQDNEAWVVCETIVKQVTKHTIYKSITPAEGFSVSTIINNLYYYGDVSYKNDTTGGTYVKLSKNHSEGYINPTTPTVYINVADNNINFTVPDVYLVNNNVSGEFMIELYETKGEIYLPLYKFNMEDFKIKINNVTLDEAEATITNITMLANSRTTLEGGKSAVSLDELRSTIISNSTGNINTPITDINLKVKSNQLGFDLRKAINIVTDRLYIAYKNIPKIESDLIYCKPDIFFNTLSIVLTELPVTSSIIKTNDYTIIKSNTLFKNVNNILEIVSDAERAELDAQDTLTIMNSLNNTEYYINPYYYIINSNNTDIQSKVYDLDNPILSDIKIVGKNTNMIERVNTDKYGMYKRDNGYELIITLVANEEFLGTNLNNVKAQIAIPVANSQELIYYDAVYDIANNLFSVFIETDFYLNTNDLLLVKNGTSNLSNTYIELKNTSYIHIYTLDTDVYDPDGYMNTEIVFDTQYDKVVFNKESFTINLGSELKHIWNMLYNTFTERKYLTYSDDRLLFHQDDVYDADPDTGSIFTCVTDTTTGDITPVYNLLHTAGDPVLDDVGNQVIVNKKGDIILDEFQLPTIDQQGGVVRHIDMLMLEYEFYKTNNNAYVNYLEVIKKTLLTWMTSDIKELNSGLLENTKIVYKSYKKINNVNVLTNNKTTSIPYSVTPKIVLYVISDVYDSTEITNLRTTIGTIIHTAIDSKEINVNVIKRDITTALGDNVVGIKITNIDPVENSEIFTLTDTSTGLSMKKKLKLNNNNELILEYDIDITIAKV